MTEKDAPAPPSARARLSPPVFFGAAGLIVLFVVLTAADPDAAAAAFTALQGWITETFGWFYMLAVAVFLVFTIGLAVSGLGNVRLGPDDSLPEFSYRSWIAMLFSAGMGIGLMFFGVAEPVMHYASPPAGAGGTVAAARQAMTIAFFHWGVHAWAIYAVIALSLAYFGYRHGMPLAIRSALYPLIGARIHGPIGHAVDIFAVLGTMFGVATSLGLGVLQINSGLGFLFGVPEQVAVQMLLIAVITAIATVSVVLGLDRGIRRLSELNLVLALALVVFVLVAGPTLFLFQALVQNTGAYIGQLVTRTFHLYAYEPTDWIAGWTLFYWAWWIAWSPFVGMFIARISKGRTIREFVVGVLLVPVGFTVIWLTVFGNSAIWLDMGPAAGAIAAAVDADVATALFEFLRHFPLGGIASLVAIVLVVSFFVTSMDSASLVVDIITSGGDTDPPVWRRIFWAVSKGVVAAVLLLAGGLAALQTAAITAALPFAFVMLFVCLGLYRGLRMEGVRRASLRLPALGHLQGAGVPWPQRLRAIVSHPRRTAVADFLHRTVRPALEEVAAELRAVGMDAKVTDAADAVSLAVGHGAEREFLYAVRLRGYTVPDFAFPEFDPEAPDEADRYWRAEVHLLEGGQDYDVMGYAKDQLIGDVLAQYEKHMHFLHAVR